MLLSLFNTGASSSSVVEKYVGVKSSRKFISEIRLSQVLV